MTGGLIVFAPEAEQELDDLFLWIAHDTGPNAATAFGERMDRAFRNLAEFPMMGRVRHEIPGSPRSFAQPPWVIFYEPLVGRKGIHVPHVIDGRRNLDVVLGRTGV